MYSEPQTRDEILDEIEELEYDQHSLFFRDEPRGRQRLAILLLRLNEIESKDQLSTGSHFAP